MGVHSLFIGRGLGTGQSFRFPPPSIRLDSSQCFSTNVTAITLTCMPAVGLCSISLNFNHERERPHTAWSAGFLFL
jgi:hypothetical protein